MHYFAMPQERESPDHHMVTIKFREQGLAVPRGSPYLIVIVLGQQCPPLIATLQ